MANFIRMVQTYRLILISLLLISNIYLPIAPESFFEQDNLFLLEKARFTNDINDPDNFIRAERTIKTFMSQWGLQGASVAIAKNGKMVYAKGFGYADTLSQEIVQPYSRFRVASVSKLITAVAIMKLCEEGKLSLSDKVFGEEGIIKDPYFDNPNDSRISYITVEHLLRHEGGWSQRFGDQMFMPTTIANAMNVDMPIDTKTIIRFALDKKLHFAPGRDKSYSNLGYGILGIVIEEVSGMSYEKYCKSAILEPLGIFDMELARNMKEDKSLHEVTYYAPKDTKLKPSIYGTDEELIPMYGGNDIEALGAAGAWIATAPDLLKLTLAIDGYNSVPDILSRESINRMVSGTDRRYPMGWISAKDGVWTRTGSFAGTSAIVKRLSDGTIWVVLFNSSSWNGTRLHNYTSTTMTRVLQQVEKWPNINLFDYTLPIPIAATN